MEAERAQLRAEMLPLWERHQALTRALPPARQQVRIPSVVALIRSGRSYMLLACASPVFLTCGISLLLWALRRAFRGHQKPRAPCTVPILLC